MCLLTVLCVPPLGSGVFVLFGTTQLVPQGEAEDEDSADYLGGTDGFAEDKYAHQHGDKGVTVAENGGLLTGHIFQGGEIEAVADARVHHAHNGEEQPAAAVHGGKGDALGGKYIGQKHRSGGQKLHKRPLDTRNAPDEFVEKHHAGIKGGGTEAAYVYPGLQRVFQAAGRVIRTETDRGVVLLVDSRYRQPNYRALMPPHWDVADVKKMSELNALLRAFWQDGKEA